MYHPIRLAAACLLAIVVTPLSAQQALDQSKGAAKDWIVTAAEIPMRDGIKLHTLIAVPRNTTEPMPIMLERSPYGTPETLLKSASPQTIRAYTEDGYVEVWQDIRGKYKSEGTFEMLRPPHDPKDIHGIDESTDTYDTIDWLIKHVPGSNGRVGIKGVSYDGWLAAMALIHPHPALKAVSPQAPVADMFLGDDFHHNGAFRLSYGFEYAWMLESGKELNYNWPIDLPDAYNWYLRLGPLSTANANYLHGKFPSWNNFAAHPNYDAFWQKHATTTYLNGPLTVPTLLVGGWYDQEDFFGPQRIYAELAKQDPNNLAYLVLGPWNHGGWTGLGPGQYLGPFDFGSETGVYYRQKIQKLWFDSWLKGAGKKDMPNFPNVWTYETGGNKWVPGDRWPPKTVVNRNLYLNAAQSASFQPPTAQDKDGFDSYTSDPAHPAPYRKRPILPTYGTGSTWDIWLTDNQKDLEMRPDVLCWKTQPLTKSVTIAGDVVADLFAATTGTDSDWVVKLLDIYPDDYPADPRLPGYELIISDEVFRGRFRKSFERPEAIPANRVEEYRIDLHGADHVFLKGHRIGVQIQSAWFPLIDRNPQKFVPNIFEAKADDFQITTQSIYRSQHHATHIVLPVKESPQL